MAKAKLDAALVKVVLTAELVKGSADEKMKEGADLEVKFGKGEKIQKFAFPFGSVAPSGVLFIGRSGRTYIADFSRYPDATKSLIVFHGSKQKLGDEYADIEAEDDCFEAMIELDTRLAEGKWTAERQGFAGMSVLMKAIMEVFQKTEAEARAFLKDLDAKEKASLRAAPELKSVIDRIESERGKGVDTAALIAKIKTQPKEGGDAAAGA